MATKQGEDKANECTLPAESFSNANLEEQGKGRNNTATMKSDCQQILTTAHYLRGEIGKVTKSIVEGSSESSAQERKTQDLLAQLHCLIHRQCIIVFCLKKKNTCWLVEISYQLFLGGDGHYHYHCYSSSACHKRQSRASHFPAQYFGRGI